MLIEKPFKVWFEFTMLGGSVMNMFNNTVESTVYSTGYFW